MRTNATSSDYPVAIPNKPYAMVGAGRLVSTLWKDGSEVGGWRYRFNVFGLSGKGGVTQRFTPADLKHLVKLVQVLTAVMADDGCLSESERNELADLAARLDEATGRGHEDGSSLG